MHVDERCLDNPLDTTQKSYMDMRGNLLQNIHQNQRKLAVLSNIIQGN
jgi:hypothetical protein